MLANHDNEQPTNTAGEGCQYKNLGHYLKISLVLTMQSYILEQELLKLSSKELEARMLSVSSNHEQLWEAEHARGKHCQEKFRNNTRGL
jgi:formyltetrahydrofolate hydrolase